ncbi:hypothetical protein K461DRAFT_228984 [Myriangium duriaei CBS 260.36]|uniref:Nitrate reductase [NADPH] n=1 Tax=Myriangium duriaei CBS 260.36 TaxID=1168546 RepID=A0A9P4ME66_9PEZI|nr:hypothetical protein K461DRAFT_228984 [Myriangium duriaei CBS 260.36]
MPQPPRKQKVGDFPGSSAEEIENEPAWGPGHSHRVGYKNKADRLAGFTEDADHWEDEEERQLAEDAMRRYREMRQEHDRGELLNFQDIMKGQTDFRKHHESRYPPTWHFVVNSTEDFVKQEQDWPANIKQREKQNQQEREKKEENKKNGQQQGDEQKENKQEQCGDKQDQKGEKQNRGGEHSTKHNYAYGPGLHAEHDTDADYERLREKYTHQEIALLRALQHEKENIHDLEQNDGKVISPVQIKDAKHRVLGVDKQDTMTPDNWIPRSANLIRQTGQHPMNAEPNFTALFEAGMITPNELHYVRSHGGVPRLFWETHILDVNDGKLRLTMDDLADRFEPINVAMAMGCDAVRRGEMNKIRKTKGFSWGPGAISNAYWKGARLCEVLAAAGVSREHVDPHKRLYVHFEGADHPSEGKYQTSISLEHVMDPHNDVILAYEMNNTPLPPDHGFPVRVVVPGYVGARCVKWLARVWISNKENGSHYHIWDNRVLPSFITEKDGEFAQTMFRHPDTACYEQNLNSIIARPAQDEKIEVEELLKKKTYRVQGIAYDGGGHQVQRVEVSIDEGKTWLYAIRKFPEKPVRNGNKFWTWCFWHVDIDAMHFARAESIVVRAFNVFKNTQPAEPIWNIMGMMNNCWYRVKIKIDSDLSHVVALHPIDPQGDGGWMKESEINQLNAVKQSSGVPDKQFTRQEIEKHDKKDDCWLVINNNVYDATSVLSWHPGGPATITANAGKLSADVTSSFNSIHDDYAHKKLQECAIGRVTDKAAKYLQEQAKANAAAAAKSNPMKSDTLLQTKRWVPVQLTHRERISADTYKYTFSYRDAGHKTLGLGTCQHIEFGIHMLDKMLVRAYTPTRPIVEDDDDGTFDLVLKTYFPDENQPGGAFGNMLLCLPIGEKVQVSGPTGEIVYRGEGKFEIEGQDVVVRKVNLVLGGSGVTPGYALIERCMREDGGKVEVRVVDANKGQKDILLKEELDEMEKKGGGRLKVTHVLSHPEKDEEWEGETGHVNAEIIKKACFAPGDGVVTFLCGPPTMIQKAALPALVEWGFEEDKNVFGF